MIRWLRGGPVLALVWAVLVCVPARAAAQRVHEVRAGQTLSSVARRYKVAVSDLALENALQPGGTLRAGQLLTIPPSGVTYVRAGQTLSQIAREHDCTVEELRRLNELGPTAQLRAGSRIALPGSLAAVGPARDWGKPERPGVVRLEGRAGRAEVEIVDAEGRLRLKGLRALTALLRGDALDDLRSIHPRLALLLARISDHFGGRPMALISGLREAGGRTRDTSRHTQGRAADIQVAGVPARVLFDYCRSLLQTGCGFYPRSGFVHVDVRERAAQWVDWSSHGRRARYGILERPYRRGESKRPDRPRLTRAVTRPNEVPLVCTVVDRFNTVVRTVDERPTEAAEQEPELLGELESAQVPVADSASDPSDPTLAD